MTEADWLACNEPGRMLKFLRRRTTDRKWRLYLCAGCRYIAHLFFHPNSVAALEVAERFADGAASANELGDAEYYAETPTFGYDFEESWWSREDT